MNTLQHIPLWVWALLALLLLLGWRQSHTTRVPRRRLVLISLAWTVYALLSLGQLLQPLGLLLPGLLLWAACNAASSWLARPLFTPALAHEGRHLLVPGSWAPLTLYLLMFGLRFAHGMFAALQPEWAQQASPLLVLAALAGLLTGLINARSLRLLQAPR